jgi:hypothetical protein
MSTRCVLGAVLYGVVAFGCAEPNKFNPADLARADAQGGSGGRGGMGGAGGVGGGGGSTGTTGGAGGTASVDAPVAGSGGDVDADPGSEAGAACNAGVTRCEGKIVEVCTVAGTWVMKEACSAVCTAGACAGMCTPGSKHCGIDQTPETCSELGEWVPDAMPCPNVCSGMGQCTGMCKPGSKRCSGPNDLTTQTCDENGAWVNGMVCPNICSSGSCGGDCMPSAKRCGANNVQETCGDKGTWEPAMTCQFVCMGAACAGECKPATKRCSALVPQECDQNGRWQSMAACPNLCMNGACTGDCVPNQKRCSGNTVQTCSPAGRYVASETCPFVCQGSGVCGGQCVPARRQCSGTTPQVCSNDGQWMNTTGNECLKDRGATCGSANECASRLCVQSHCCNSGETYCDGQCRDDNYCCTNATCPISNGTGRCMNGSCGVASCNSGYTSRNGQCVPCGGQNQPCCTSGTACTGSRHCSGSSAVVEPFCDNGTCHERTQDTCDTCESCSNNACNRVAGAENQPCCNNSCPGGSGLRCVDNRCIRPQQNGSPCTNDNQCSSMACISGTCGTPCTNGAKRCRNATTEEECINRKWVPHNCRDDGALAVCSTSGSSCNITGCVTPLPDGTSGCCADDAVCGTGGVCRSNTCYTGRGEQCDFGNQICEPNTSCLDDTAAGHKTCR